MELSDKQLTEIKTYVAQECKYPDLQVEILEHIQYRIADLLTQNNWMRVEDAFDVCRLEFGKQGFKVFEESMRASLKNKYHNMAFKTLKGHFKPKYLLVGAILMLWVYLFFVDVRPTDFSRIGSSLNVILPFLPLYVVLSSSFFKPAKHFKGYFTFIIGNGALFRLTSFALLGSVIIFIGVSLNISGRLQLAGLAFGAALLLYILILRTGYAVRKASIADCRDFEIRNKAYAL